MSGLGPLGPLVPIKPELQVVGPGPVTQAEALVNDVRLPSRAAVEQQIGVGLLKSDPRSSGGLAARSDPAVMLSATARAVSAILENPTGATARIVGTQALLVPLQLQQPSSVIAAALACTVSGCGLFYESHLAQFAAGSKSLAELAQEPQARLVENLKLALAGLLQGSGPAGNPTAGLADSRAAQSAALPADKAAPEAIDPPDVAAPRTTAGLDFGDPAPSLEAAHLQKNAYASMQEAGVSTSAVKNHDDSAANMARVNTPVLAGIHPDALALVRQQLELLAQPAFRWSGEAWPAVPLEWEIHKDEREPVAAGDAAPRSWSTRLGLTLPALKDIEVRIILTGHTLQVRLAASEDATRDRLREARTELPTRLSALGLELTELQIGALVTPVAANTPRTANGAQPDK